MKKTLLLIAVALFVSSTAFSQFKFGVGAAMGTKAKIDATGFKMGFGVNARGVYEINDQLSATGGFTFYLPSTLGSGTSEVKLTNYSFNAGAIFYILDGDESRVYATGGFNWATLKTKVNGVTHSANGTSWEVGGGIEFGNFFAEVKYDANWEQIVGTAGIYF